MSGRGTHRINWALGLLVLMTQAGFAWAAEPLIKPSAPREAVVTRVIPRVDWLRQGTQTWQRAAIGHLLAPGDTLRTGADAKAELWYGDGSLGRVGSLSSLTLQGEQARSLRLDAGQLWLHIMKGGAGMRVITPGAVAAVTGTQLMVEVDPVRRQTEVTVFEGAVNVTGDIGELVRVTGGQNTVVPFAAPAGLPAPLGDRQIERRENLFRPLSLPDTQSLQQPASPVEAAQEPVTTAEPAGVKPGEAQPVPPAIAAPEREQTQRLMDPRLLNGSPVTGAIKVIVE